MVAMCQAKTYQLPNVRKASMNLHPEDNQVATRINMMAVTFGQFMDHDMSLSPEHENNNCCDPNEPDPECFPITVPPTDSFYSQFNITCLGLTRSLPHCSSEPSPSMVREQMNVITSFLDASNVYGSSDEQGAKDVRIRSFENGKLKVTSNNLLPEEGKCKVPVAGDQRASENPGLTSLHALFVREHNRIIDDLLNLPVEWHKFGDQGCTRDECDEILFQNARRILIAEWQNVIYSEWLPIFLGTTAMSTYNLTLSPTLSTYDGTVDPGILVEFSTAAFRFGHSLVQGMVQKNNLDGSFRSNIPLSNTFFNATEYQHDGMEQLLAGLVAQPSQKFDRFATSQLNNLLFKQQNHFGQDLMARNIARGRDHGLPSYAEYYKLWGPQSDANRGMECWSQRPQSFSPSSWDSLRNIYIHPQDIDLFTGGLLEEKDTSATGGALGLLFRNIVATQFHHLKFGDRFFFTHKGMEYYVNY